MAEELAERLDVAGVLLEVEDGERRPEGMDVRRDPGPRGEPVDDPPDHTVIAVAALDERPFGGDQVVVRVGDGSVRDGRVDQPGELVGDGLPDDLAALLVELDPLPLAVVVLHPKQGSGPATGAEVGGDRHGELLCPRLPCSEERPHIVG